MTRVMCAVHQSVATQIKRFTQRSSYRRALVSGASGCNVLPLPADVAQLVEQRFRKPQVTGSNPVVGSPSKMRRFTYENRAFIFAFLFPILAPIVPEN